jgi:acyl-CoA synthetase (AMP-forming)/AMP-acid ligase II
VLGAAVATHLSVAELRAALAPLCPLWKIPKRWTVCEQLPVNARGKLDLAQIRSGLFPVGSEKS